MNSLIRFIAQLISRRIERGSLLFSLIGAIGGAAAGVGAAWLLRYLELEQDVVAPAIAMGIFGALAGALIGSTIGPQRAPARGARGTVRIWNLNSALVPYFFAAVCAAVAIWLSLIKFSKDDDPVVRHGLATVMGIVFLILMIVSAYQTLWIDLGPQIVLRRLLRPFVYDPDHVSEWGFAVRRGEMTQNPPPCEAEFCIRLTDGRSFISVVQPETARAIADILAGSNAPEFFQFL